MDRVRMDIGPLVLKVETLHQDNIIFITLNILSHLFGNFPYRITVKVVLKNLKME